MVKQIDVYQVVLTATFETEADSTQDAIDKAEEYYKVHLDEADYQVTKREVWVRSDQE